jgi:diguanylate cyclase (GGDEF)-like protein
VAAGLQLHPRKDIQGSVLREAIEYAAAVEQSNLVLTAITSGLRLMFFIAANDTRELLYANYTATSMFAGSAKFLRQVLRLPVRPVMEFQFMFHDMTHYYTVTTYPLLWSELKATAYLLNDVTAEKVPARPVFAHQDALTGLDNRLAGIMTLNKWLDQKREFIVCLANMDNIRYINNTFGRAEGDLCIRLAAELYAACLTGAYLSKMRGDEFLILIPNASLEGAEAMLRRAGDRIKAKTDDRPYFCDLSYGLVEVGPRSTDLASDVLALADERMQRSKLSGKKYRMLDIDTE